MKYVTRGPYQVRYKARNEENPGLFFDKDTFKCLGRSESLLNSSTINNCSLLLKEHYDDRPISIFSTFLSTCRDDEQLWRFVKNTRFWDTEVWIFPVHLPDEIHWTLSTAYISDYRLNVFDSFGNTSTEKKVASVSSYSILCCIFVDYYIQITLGLIKRLVRLANDKGYYIQLDTDEGNWTICNVVVRIMKYYKNI